MFHKFKKEMSYLWIWISYMKSLVFNDTSWDLHSSNIGIHDAFAPVYSREYLSLNRDAR